MHIDDVERHECTVNSSELAAHARALQRSKHQLLNTYRKNPSVSTLFGGKNIGRGLQAPQPAQTLSARGALMSSSLSSPQMALGQNLGQSLGTPVIEASNEQIPLQGSQPTMFGGGSIDFDSS